MNKFKADFVLDTIKDNLDKRKELVLETLSVEESPSQSIGGVFYLQTINSMLFELSETLKNRDFDSRFFTYVQTHNYNDKNISKIAADSNAKIKSIKDLKAKVENCFENSKYYYNSFVYNIYLDLQHAIEREASVEVSPSTLLYNLNEKRSTLGLSSVNFASNTVLNNLLIDKDKIVTGLTADYTTLFNNLKSQCEKCGLKVSTQDIEQSTIKNNNIILSSNLTNDSNNLVGDSLNYLNLLYLTCSALSQDNFNSILKNNLEDVQTIQQYISKASLDYSLIETNFNQLVNLIVTQNILFTQVPAKEFAQLSKVIEFNIAQKLALLTKVINSESLLKLVINSVKNNTVQLYNILDIDLEKLHDVYRAKNIRILDSTKIESYALCPLNLDYDAQSKVVGKIYELDYKNIKKLNNYIARLDEYKQKFIELLKYPYFGKNKALDVNSVYKKIDNLYKELTTLKEYIETNNHLLSSQYKVMIDSHAFCEVAEKVTSKISKEVFNHTITNKKPYIVPTFDVETIKMENNEYEELKDINFPFMDDLVDNDLTTKYTLSQEEVEQKEKNSMKNKNLDFANFAYDYTSNWTNNDAQITEEKPVAEQVAEVQPVEEVKENVENIIEVEENIDENSVEQLEQESNNTKVVDNQPKVQVEEQLTETLEPITPKRENATEESLSILEQKLNQLEKDLQQKLVTTQPTKKPENTEMRLMEEKYDQLTKHYDELNEKLEKLTKLYNTKHPKEVDAEKLAAMEVRIAEITNKSLKKSVASLANKNVDELSKRILYSTKEDNSTYSVLLASLNMLFNIESTDKTVRNMFIAMNKAETVKELMLLKHSLETTFSKMLTKFIARQAVEYYDENLSDKDLITKTLSTLNTRLVTALEDSRLAEIDMLRMQYEEGSFEYQDALDEINARFLGDDEQIGLMDQLKQSLYITMLKEVVLSEVRTIDYCEKNKQKYTFNEKHAERLLRDLFVEKREEVEELVN